MTASARDKKRQSLEEVQGEATMLTATSTSELVLGGVFSVIGLMGNTFILTVNLMKRIKDLEINVRNIIISSLAVTNICLQCTMLTASVCHIYWEENVLLDEVLTVDVAVGDGLCCSSLWFATWLGVYYCLKIVNCNHPCLIGLKVQFPKIVPWLLIGSVLVSLANGISGAFARHGNDTAKQASNNSENITPVASGNGTMNDFVLVNGPSTLLIIQLLISSVAFIIFSFAIVAIITSLLRHMRRMAQNTVSFQNPNLKAHVGALKTLVMLLILYLTFYLSHVLVFVKPVALESFRLITFKLPTFAFPALCSLILILGNPTMKKTLVKIFYQPNCCKREGA
ncbi:taste receptor type 2 member 116-like [Ambystoma mexicanum]|uniref:taste receptor type 2 member 116-like n=1 Tax=Ambystoma mexicanum TaxID=8296 RepID=UPI0037E89236